MTRRSVLLLAWMVLTLLPFAATYAAEIIVPDDYPTIQQAIDAASDGDTVTVRADTYTERLTINKPLTLQSEDGAAVTIIDAEGTDTAIRITANNVTVRGFTVINGEPNGIHMSNASNVTIRSNVIQGGDSEDALHGVFVVGGSNVDLIENELTGYIMYSAVMYFSTSDSSIKGNHVHDNIAGIAIAQWLGTDPLPDNFTISNNVVEKNDGFDPVSGHPSGFGIWFVGSNIALRNNMIGPDNRMGVFMYDQPFHPAHVPNDPERAYRAGIAASREVLEAAGTLPRITAQPAARTSSATGNTAHLNNIAGNIYGMENQAATDLDARSNWWGHANGPTLWGGTDTGGDILNPDNVIYDPWLEAPAPDIVGFEIRRETGDVLTPGAYFGEAFVTKNGDLAEWVPVSEPAKPGHVLEIDPAGIGQYRLAQGPCTLSVAGVVSTQPGMILGNTSSPEEKALLALLGVVPLKVTDEGGAIAVGDLLVVSSTPGYAMRWDPEDGAPCALVGKALEDHIEGVGVVLVLLTR